MDTSQTNPESLTKGTELKSSINPPELTQPAPSPNLAGRLIREPLVHFLVLGAFIFALYSLVGRPQGTIAALPQIQVTAPVIQILKADWQRQWGSLPSPSELQTLIDQYVHDEVFYQEALALGLDQNDIIVRRRLIQKVEFLAEDVSALQEPSDPILQSYLDEHRQRYVIPGRISFDQLYFSRELRGNQAQIDASTLLAQLQENPEKPVMGDRSMLPTSFTLASFQELTAVFGEGFGAQLTSLEKTGWQGPFRSAYGSHLVHVTELEPGHDATLAEVRGDVRLDWLRDQRQQQDERVYQELRDRYTITIDPQALQAATEEASA